MKFQGISGDYLKSQSQKQGFGFRCDQEGLNVNYDQFNPVQHRHLERPNDYIRESKLLGTCRKQLYDAYCHTAGNKEVIFYFRIMERLATWEENGQQDDFGSIHTCEWGH